MGEVGSTSLIKEYASNTSSEEEKITQYHHAPLSWGPAGLFREAGFATFLNGISGNWVLKLWETGLDTPTVPGMASFFYSVNGKNMK